MKKSPESHRPSGDFVILFEQQRGKFLQAAAPGEELMACVGRDVADGIQAIGGEGLYKSNYNHRQI